MQHSTGLRAEKLNDRLQMNFKFCKLILALAISVSGIYFYYPLTSYIVDAKFVQLIPLEFMFVDQVTTSGFCIATCIITAAAFVTVFGTLFVGITFAIIILSYATRVDMLETDFNELDNMWGDDAYISKTLTSTIVHSRHMFLKNMYRKCIDMRE